MDKGSKKFLAFFVLIFLFFIIIFLIFVLRNYLSPFKNFRVQNEIGLNNQDEEDQMITEKIDGNENYADMDFGNQVKSLSTSSATKIIDKIIKLDVPFTSQAPLGEWDDIRQQNACEEAAALMAMKWVRGESIVNPEQAKKEILNIVDFQVKEGNFNYSTSTRDTVKIIYKGYFGYEKVKVVEDATTDDIKNALESGSLVVAATNGQLLGNPYYTQPGPSEHMLVIIGYDPKTKEFITNDPGTKRGKDYRYKEDILYKALRDYPTGYKEPITKIEKLLIVVEK